jgi:VWFA-related protein
LRVPRVFVRFFVVFTLAALFISGTRVQAQQSSPSNTQQLPDAPAPQFPSNPSAMPGSAPLPPQAGVQPDQPAPPEPEAMPTQPAPLAPPKTVANKDQLDQVFRVNVNLKMIAVTVKDNSGRLVQDLQQNDFAVYENEVPQQIRYFSNEPFPLSAAVVIDTGLPDTTLGRIKQTLRSLIGAFGPYDEVAVFSYGGTVTQQSDFAPITSAHFTTAVAQLNKVRGQFNGGVPIASGPLASGPTVNNRPLDPNTRPRGIDNPSGIRDARVMNDALLAAAESLSRRPRARRKMVLLISDGREYNSRTSYSDVLKVLLNDEIMVYAIAVDTGAIPLLNKIEQIHIPTQGYGDLLPKYTNATGGAVYRELTRNSLEQTYARVTADARNQYTIGYRPKTPNVTGEYRQIDVRVHRRNLRVFAPDGYNSLPPRQQ